MLTIIKVILEVGHIDKGAKICAAHIADYTKVCAIWASISGFVDSTDVQSFNSGS